MRLEDRPRELQLEPVVAVVVGAGEVLVRGCLGSVVKRDLRGGRASAPAPAAQDPDLRPEEDAGLSAVRRCKSYGGKRPAAEDGRNVGDRAMCLERPPSWGAPAGASFDQTPDADAPRRDGVRGRNVGADLLCGGDVVTTFAPPGDRAVVRSPREEGHIVVEGGADVPAEASAPAAQVAQVRGPRPLQRRQRRPAMGVPGPPPRGRHRLRRMARSRRLRRLRTRR